MPEAPDDLQYLWEHFVRLSGRRQNGMAANPITYQEVEAYERKALVRLSAWETDLLMRLDAAVLAVWAGNRNPAARPDEPNEPIPAENVKGLKALFRGLAIRKASKAAKPPQT
jgi:hypothetical protein